MVNYMYSKYIYDTPHQASSRIFLFLADHPSRERESYHWLNSYSNHRFGIPDISLFELRSKQLDATHTNLLHSPFSYPSVTFIKISLVHKVFKRH